MRPVCFADLPELVRLKGDPLIYATMLGGVRNPVQAADELAADIAFWGQHGVGMWGVRPSGGGALLGLVGLHARPDGRGMALRFAVSASAQGRGLAREAGGAALRFAHDRAAIPRVIAVAKASNFRSRMVLGGIGMRECGEFDRNGDRMLIFESLASPAPT